MAQTTGIEWTDATWNPIRGCSRVSEGCRNCYAEKVAYRFSDAGQPYHGLVGIGGRWNGQIKFVEEHLLDPLKWKKPRRIFVNSMSDLFHPNVTDEMLEQIALVMCLGYWHTYQVLTKRPENLPRWTAAVDAALQYIEGLKQGGIAHKELFRALDKARRDDYLFDLPLRNVWLGVSVEDQKAADARIPLLLQTPAAKRFISAEPLLGAVNLRRLEYLKAIAKPGWQGEKNYPFPGMPDEDRSYFVDFLDWVICGGESGPGARPMHPDWARSLRDQCVTAEVPFFFKQWGEWGQFSTAKIDEFLESHPGTSMKTPTGLVKLDGRVIRPYCMQDAPGHEMIRIGKKAAGHLLDGKEWHQFPEVRA